MVSSLFFYQLALIALLWLCLLLQDAGPRDQAVIRPPPPALTPSRRQRRRALTSYEGLTPTPPCDACEPPRALPPHAPSTPAPPAT